MERRWTTPSALLTTLVDAVARARRRVGQGLRYLAARHDPAVDAALRALLRPAEWALVARLAPGDRAHLLDTRRRLEWAGCDDPDLLLAALLHDVGKADERARVLLGHRVAAVLLGRAAPGLLARLAAPSRWRLRHGLYLAVAHPRLGADLARRAGCPERVCWLIAHHHDRPAADASLARLQAVDEEA